MRIIDRTYAVVVRERGETLAIVARLTLEQARTIAIKTRVRLAKRKLAEVHVVNCNETGSVQ